MMSIKEFLWWIVTVVSGKPVDMERPNVDLHTMTKKELVAYGESIGVPLQMHMTKQKMIDKLT